MRAYVAAADGKRRRRAPHAARVRFDKWLWAARFYKTRSLAAQAIDAGQARLAGARVKPAHAVRVGDAVSVRRRGIVVEVVVTALLRPARIGDRRGASSIARRRRAWPRASRRRSRGAGAARCSRGFPAGRPSASGASSRIFSTSPERRVNGQLAERNAPRSSSRSGSGSRARSPTRSARRARGRSCARRGAARARIRAASGMPGRDLIARGYPMRAPRGESHGCASC